jgi:hypothetical protein
MQSLARFRLTRRASLNIDGSAKPVDVDGLGNQADRVRIRGSNASGMFLGANSVTLRKPPWTPCRHKSSKSLKMRNNTKSCAA